MCNCLLFKIRRLSIFLKTKSNYLLFFNFHIGVNNRLRGVNVPNFIFYIIGFLMIYKFENYIYNYLKFVPGRSDKVRVANFTLEESNSSVYFARFNYNHCII